MKSRSEVKLFPRSVKKYLRRQKSLLRHRLTGVTLEQEMSKLIQRFRHGI